MQHYCVFRKKEMSADIDSLLEIQKYHPRWYIFVYFSQTELWLCYLICFKFVCTITDVMEGDKNMESEMSIIPLFDQETLHRHLVQNIVPSLGFPLHSERLDKK